MCKKATLPLAAYVGWGEAVTRHGVVTLSKALMPLRCPFKDFLHDELLLHNDGLNTTSSLKCLINIEVAFTCLLQNFYICRRVGPSSSSGLWTTVTIHWFLATQVCGVALYWSHYHKRVQYLLKGQV